jgi:hypothetical protein
MYGAGLGSLMGGGGDFSQASFGLGPSDDVSHLINLDSLLSQVGGAQSHSSGQAAGAGGGGGGGGGVFFWGGKGMCWRRTPPHGAPAEALLAAPAPAAGRRGDAVHRPGHRAAAGRRQGQLRGAPARTAECSQTPAQRACARAPLLVGGSSCAPLAGLCCSSCLCLEGGGSSASALRTRRQDTPARPPTHPPTHPPWRDGHIWAGSCQ